jgi:DNA polymerase III epsilon subunit-like protein
MSATMTRTETRPTSCIIDTETGGLKPKHPTIQIAAICVDSETFEEVDAIEMKLRFDPAACDPEALELNSYDPDRWATEALAVGIVTLRLDKFFRKHADLKMIGKDSGKPYQTARLIGHNVGFDAPRLVALWGDTYPPFCWWQPIDTVQLALWYFFTEPDPAKRPRDFKLGTLCEWFEIEVSDDAHDALYDCRLVAELLKKLNRVDEEG